MARETQVTFDAADPDLLMRFWCEVLGYERDAPPPGFDTWDAALDLATGVWQTYEGGLWFGADPGEGRALALAGERLYVGGSFDRAGSVTTSSLAALHPATGRWEGFGAGVRQGDFIGTVDSLAVEPDTVFVGGSFTSAGTVTDARSARLSDRNVARANTRAILGSVRQKLLVSSWPSSGRSGLPMITGAIAADQPR